MPRKPRPKSLPDVLASMSVHALRALLVNAGLEHRAKGSKFGLMGALLTNPKAITEDIRRQADPSSLSDYIPDEQEALPPAAGQDTSQDTSILGAHTPIQNEDTDPSKRSPVIPYHDHHPSAHTPALVCTRRLVSPPYDSSSRRTHC